MIDQMIHYGFDMRGGDFSGLSTQKFAFYGANQCLGFLEAQTDVARLQVL